MAANDLATVWQSLETLRIFVREQALSSLATISEYASYFKTQIGALAMQMQAWAVSSLIYFKKAFAYGYAQAAYFLKHFPQFALNALRKGFEYGYHFGSFVLRHLWQAIQAIPEVMKSIGKTLWQAMLKGYHLGVELLTFIVNHFAQFLNFLKEALIFVAKELYSFLCNLPRYIQQLYQLTKNVLRSIFNFVWPFLKELGQMVFEGVKWFVKGIGERLFMGLGMVYAISALLVEGLAYGLNALLMKTIGINLAAYSAFGTLQTALSVMLAAAIIISAVRYTYLAIAGLFGLSLLNRSMPRNVHPEKERIVPTPQADPLLDQVQPMITSKFQERSANDPDVLNRPIPQRDNQHSPSLLKN